MRSLKFLLLVTFVSGVLAEAIFHALRASGMRDVLPPIVAIVLPPLIAGTLLPYLLIRLAYRSTLRDFGVYWWKAGRPFVAWTLVPSVIVLLGWFGFWSLLLVALGFAPDPQVTAADLQAKNPLAMWLSGNHSPRLGATILHMMVSVGFVEELFGRGFLQNALDRIYAGTLGRGRFRVRVSTLIAALLFAFWHTEWLSFDVAAILKSLLVSMTIILVPSLILAVVYEKTRSMLAVILLHDVIDGGKLVAWYVAGLLFAG